jgi:hypothetical protein
MANDTLPLNTFGNQAIQLTTSPQDIYTVPAGITTIVLGAQASNINNIPVTINFTLVKADASEFILLNDFEVPTNDSAEVTTGKLVITQGETLTAYASVNTSINLILSYLETSNE